MSPSPRPEKAKIRLNDDNVRLPDGPYPVADLKQQVEPPIPADHTIWISVNGAPNIALDSAGTVDIVEGLVLYSESPDGAAHPHHTPIVIDGQHVTSENESVTGTLIRRLVTPAIGSDRDLYRDIDGAPDERIDDGEVVTLKKGAEFYSVPKNIAPGSN